jgi:predicted esterase
MRDARSTLLVMLIIASCACAQNPLTGGPFAVSLKEPATTCQLYVPEKSKGAMPLVIGLHPARTPAEAAMGWWQPEGKTRGWVVLCPKARGDNWQESDGDIIKASLADVRKTYKIDERRIAIGGYSSGAFMVTRWALAQPGPWRAAFAHAGSAPPAKIPHVKTLGMLMSCGDQDRFLDGVREGFAHFQKAGLLVRLRLYEGMDHYRTKPEVWSAAYDFFEVCFAPAKENLEAAQRAGEKQSWSEAVLRYQAVLRSDVKGKERKTAKKGLSGLEKAATKAISKAKKAAKKKRRESMAALESIAEAFAGLKTGEKAQAALKGLRKKQGP